MNLMYLKMSYSFPFLYYIMQTVHGSILLWNKVYIYVLPMYFMWHITPKIWKFTVELLFSRYIFSHIHKYYEIRIQSRTGNFALNPRYLSECTEFNGLGFITINWKAIIIKMISSRTYIVKCFVIQNIIIVESKYDEVSKNYGLYTIVNRMEISLTI